METTPINLEPPDGKMVGLLQDLRECLGKERKCLIDLNVKDLWTVMEDKQVILKAIEELTASEDASEKTAASPMRPQIERLKADIYNRARENAGFIQGSLAVFDELVFRIAGSAGEDQTYRPRGAQHAARQSQIFRRKV